MKDQLEKRALEMARAWVDCFPEGYMEEVFQGFKEEINKRFPDMMDYTAGYWASRLVMLDISPEDRWELIQDHPDEPREIVLKIYPCYGS